MEKAIARLGRDNHLNNLIDRLPLLTIIYGLQCFMIYGLDLGVNIGEYALFMGASLIIFVGCLYVYDTQHHVLLYSDHILIYFQPLNTCQKILYQDIKEIITPDKECDFSSIILRLKTGESVSLHFIDFPVHVKQVIQQIKNGEYNATAEETKEAA